MTSIQLSLFDPEPRPRPEGSTCCVPIRWSTRQHSEYCINHPANQAAL